MKRKRIIKHRVAALFVSFSIMSGLVAPAFTINAHAEAAEVLNATTTVADLILSYCASGGVAVMNTTVINDLYQNVGTEFGTLQTFVNDGLLTYSNGQYVDTGLSTSIASAIENINSFDISSIFNQTASQNPAGVALSGSATLAGIAGSVATTGFLPVTIGVAVSGYCGFQIGTIISNMIQEYGPAIGNGVPVNIGDDNVCSKLVPGARCSVVKLLNSTGTTFEYIYYSGKNCMCIYYPGTLNFVCYSGASNPAKIINVNRLGVVTSEKSSVRSKNTNSTLDSLDSRFAWLSNCIRCNNQSEFTNIFNGLKDGSYTLPSINSPDLIGPNGNLVGSYQNGEYTVPDILPQIDPSYQRVNPGGLTQDDWLRYANQSAGNSANPEINGDIFGSIMDAIRSIIPGADVPGDNPGDDPGSVPGNVPQPTPTPNPDYDVDQPDTNSSESETPETDPNLNPPDFVLPNLMEKFPFCIPNDIATIFGKFRNQTRQAPYISWTFNPPGTPIDYTFDLNLSEFEEVAALLRTLELIAFVVGLAYATRYLIGSS